MRASRSIPLAFTVVGAALGACDAYDDDLGPTPFLCGASEPRCPAGYACIDDATTGQPVCVSEGGLDGELACTDDSAREPDDMLGDATPIDPTGAGAVDLAGAICPAADVDTFAFDVPEGGAIALTLVVDPAGGALRGRILNAGGVPIATATASAGSPRTLRALAEQLPAGLYHAQISTAALGGVAVNNYTLSVELR